MGEIARDEVVRDENKSTPGHAGTSAPLPTKRRRRGGRSRSRSRTKPPQKALRLTTRAYAPLFPVFLRVFDGN